MNYVVMWWDASGNARVSEKLDKKTATIFRNSMFAEQDARIVYVR